MIGSPLQDQIKSTLHVTLICVRHRHVFCKLGDAAKQQHRPPLQAGISQISPFLERHFMFKFAMLQTGLKSQKSSHFTTASYASMAMVCWSITFWCCDVLGTTKSTRNCRLLAPISGPMISCLQEIRMSLGATAEVFSNINLGCHRVHNLRVVIYSASMPPCHPL